MDIWFANHTDDELLEEVRERGGSSLLSRLSREIRPDVSEVCVFFFPILFQRMPEKPLRNVFYVKRGVIGLQGYIELFCCLGLGIGLSTGKSAKFI